MTRFRGTSALTSLTVVAVSLLTSGCGSSDSGEQGSFTLAAEVVGDGSVSPASAVIDAGNTTRFTITPAGGNMIESVSGCGGVLDGDVYTTAAIQADCSIIATFTSLPYVAISDVSIGEGDSGTTTLEFTISLDKAAKGDLSVDYASADGSAITGRDYTAVSGTATINNGDTSTTISLPVQGDITPEADETLSLTLTNPSANALLGTAVATGTIVNDDLAGQLNDTGITLCTDQSDGISTSNQVDIDCAAAGATRLVDGVDSEGDPVPGGQDAHFGRDATDDDDSDGHAGFSFTRVCNSGEWAGEGDCPAMQELLGAGANDWGCILDNVTGLMWENKTLDKGLRYWGWAYSWYNPDDTVNGGDAGTENGGICYDDSNCDTDKYVTQVNSSGGICGYTDWRMPTRTELMSIVDYSVDRNDQAVDNDYFPSTAYSFFWTASPMAYSQYAWIVSFRSNRPEYWPGGGQVYRGDKSSLAPVRLVRSTY